MPNPRTAKLTRGGTRPPLDNRASGKAGTVTERTAAWPAPGPVWATSFNRKTRVPVVKTRARKHGID